MNNPYAITQVEITEWEILGFIYVGASEVIRHEYRYDWAEVIDRLYEIGLTSDDIIFHDNGGCAACGTHFAHGAAVLNKLTNTVIAIGGICAGTWNIAADIGVRAARARKGAANAAIDAGRLREANAFLAENPALVAAFLDEHQIIQDIHDKLLKWGSISPAQVDLVFKIAGEADERAEKAKVADARQAALDAAPELTEGRYIIEGIVISTKWKEGYMPGEQTLKMLVEMDDLNRVWGTVPAAIIDVELRTRVTFTAAVTRSNDDTHFGFFSRPSKALVLDTPAVV